MFYDNFSIFSQFSIEISYIFLLILWEWFSHTSAFCFTEILKFLAFLQHFPQQTVKNKTLPTKFLTR